MKFSLLRPALALGVALTLASCGGGGGGKEQFPIHVQVYNLQYPGLVLTDTISNQDLTVTGTSSGDTPLKVDFPNKIEYGKQYNVVPKSVTDGSTTVVQQPKHQTCTPGAVGFPNVGTAGLLPDITIAVGCQINAYPIGGTIKGLTGTGLVLINGSNGGQFNAVPVLDSGTNKPNDIIFGPVLQDAVTTGLYSVPYGQTYGISIYSQPQGQTCVVTSGGGNGDGSGKMDDDAEAKGGVGDIVITCTP